MANAQLHSFFLEGTSKAAGRSWQPALQLFEQTTRPADHQRPVLYIHGATFAAENSVFFQLGGTSWADELNEAGFSVWAIDFAGFGRSEAYPEMAADVPAEGEPLGRVPEAATQIERAVRTILVKTGAAKVSIIAHSWGTMVAGRFAEEHSRLVDRLVLFGPIVRRQTLKNVPQLGPWRLLTVEEQRRRFTEDVPQGEKSVLLEDDFPTWTDRYLKADATSSTRTPPSVKTPNGPLADIMSAWSGSLAYQPALITAPVLIVRGEWDSLCRDKDVAWLKQALVSSPEVSDVKVPRATHLMHLESGRTALYAAAITFLQASMGAERLRHRR